MERNSNFKAINSNRQGEDNNSPNFKRKRIERIAAITIVTTKATVNSPKVRTAT